jgi:ABC-type transport system involved in cytochrome bd biosynthesis fused ATPase/permease subunit
VGFSPNGKRIVSGGSKTVRVWDAATGKESLTLKGHRGAVMSVAFSPDGKRIVSGRIGIARALYTDPDLLVLDEATSALDNATESALFEALQALAGRKTVVMVAHRLSTVRGCDLICLMDAGRIVERGRYEDLMRTSTRFRALAVG